MVEGRFPAMRLRNLAIPFLCGAAACSYIDHPEPPRGEPAPPAAAAAVPATTPYLPEHLAGYRERLLAIHNEERAAVGAPPLVWDERLAAGAARYIPELASRTELVHSVERQRPGQGENLWKGTRDAFTVENMARGWAREKALFRPGIFPQVSSNGRWADVGHYTQLIWKDTRRLGCAIAQEGGWDYLVCRYAPPGNVFGEPVP
jgi:hypothetical protein